ncbi:MAG: HipA domain-containing protein [Sandaracinaceae bacterium]|nr:HipA domain-containing protein [Sandaracinaceae bacterium]
MSSICHIEAFVAGRWQVAARLERRDAQRTGLWGWLEYEPLYTDEALGARDLRAVSVRYPVSYGLERCGSLPAFAADLLPQGEARRHVLARLRRDGGETSDWDVLLAGARNPVGNLRVAEAVTPAEESRDGVTLAEIVERGDTFRAWAESQQLPMTGSSDTGGASPKLLMTEDASGCLHADGALPDERAFRHLLIKFPRGRTQQDAAVLANEAPYLEVLRALGLRCGAPLVHQAGTLVVPRFDRRRVDGAVVRLGMESAYSLMGVSEAGARLSFEALLEQLAQHVDDPARDVLELILRDAAALALGNPDNHGRNTSLLKHADGRVELSPVYDFAPMCLDPDLIVRQTRWRSEPGDVDWDDVVRAVSERLPSLLPVDALVPALRSFGERLGAASEIMRDVGVDRDLVTRVEPRIRATSAALCALRAG